MVLLKKGDRDEEFYYAATKTKGKKKVKDAASKGKTINHNAATFQFFDKLKLDAPLSTDQVPSIVEKLEAQLEDYNAKVKDWEVNRDSMKAKILAGEEVEEEKKEDEKTED